MITVGNQVYYKFLVGIFFFTLTGKKFQVRVFFFIRLWLRFLGNGLFSINRLLKLLIKLKLDLVNINKLKVQIWIFFSTLLDFVVFQGLCTYTSKDFCSFIPELVLFFCQHPNFLKCNFMTRYVRRVFISLVCYCEM